jgi:hypothetical protein
MSTEHTFKPRLHTSSDNVNGRKSAELEPRAALLIEGSTHSAAVRTVLEDSRARVNRRSEGRIDGRDFHAKASPEKTVEKADRSDRFERLYQHGVSKGLEKLSAQVTAWLAYDALD